MYSGMTLKALDWQKKIRKFVNDELIPWEVHAEMNNGELPKEIEKKHREIALKLGLSGMGIPNESGGLGLSMFEQMIVWEQLGRVTNALSWCFPEVQDWMINNFTQYQKDNYMNQLLKGDKRECYAISEKGAASDVEGSIQSTAEKKGWALSKKGNKDDKKALADAGMKVGKVNAELKKHFEGVGATMAKEWADRAGSRGQGVLAAYK